MAALYVRINNVVSEPKGGRRGSDAVIVYFLCATLDKSLNNTAIGGKEHTGSSKGLIEHL